MSLTNILLLLLSSHLTFPRLKPTTNTNNKQSPHLHARPFNHGNSRAPIIQNTEIASTPICQNLFPSSTGLKLVGVVGNLVNTPLQSGHIWNVIWNGIKRLVATPDIVPFITQASAQTQLQLGQNFGGFPGTNYIGFVSNEFVEYTLEQATFDGDPLVSRDVCRIKVEDPDLTAILYDIFTVYNGNTPEWFFCTEISINFFITPDDAVNYGADSKKFHFEIRFENDCADNGPEPLATEVYKIENLNWDSVVLI
eukprot:GAHX01002288.1.p1 GENE.GAHX01002288.1~~GAHX01002288.1.p1  ORF type:complete len:253 (-),score=31.38 GAHX01002288.1:370-1128(-)